MYVTRETFDAARVFLGPPVQNPAGGVGLQIFYKYPGVEGGAPVPLRFMLTGCNTAPFGLSFATAKEKKDVTAPKQRRTVDEALAAHAEDPNGSWDIQFSADQLLVGDLAPIVDEVATELSAPKVLAALPFNDNVHRIIAQVANPMRLLLSPFVHKSKDAEKAARDGTLTGGERDLIHNALSLSSTRVADILTPRNVVIAYDEDLTASEMFAENPTIRFSRMPVYEESLDEISGLVRRRDILHSIATGHGERKLKELKQPVSFVPEMATAANALQTLLSANQQLAAVVDEYGGFVGVVSIEDIVEHLIGREIYEKDDVAVDMRALARRRGRSRRDNTASATP